LNSSKPRNEQIKGKAKNKDNKETLVIKKRKGGVREDIKGEKDINKKKEEEYKPKLKPL
jgi:hypothetical protein